MTSGVITGLEVDFELVDGALFLHVAPGTGVAASGEDITVPAQLRLPLSAIPRLDAGDPPQPRPSISVLVAAPVVADLVGAADPQDPCEQDPANDPFDDWQRVDGCRIACVGWPADWLVPPLTPRLRNLLVTEIFEREAQLLPGAILPWEAFGLPIALLVTAGASDDLQFVDRYAVVRGGGRPRRRTTLLPLDAGAGAQFPPGGVPSLPLRQARMQQLAAHLISMSALPLETTSQRLRHLPPSGILPREALTPRPAANHFFPDHYVVEVLPVPLEELDAALKASAAMAPFDLDAPDEVRVLVPVPQAVWEPGLLVTEQVDPAFQMAVDHFVTERGLRLFGRRLLRGTLTRADTWIDGTGDTFPAKDPQALEDPESESDDPTDPLRVQAAALQQRLTAIETAIASAKPAILTSAEATAFPALDGNGQVASGSMAIKPFIDWLKVRVDLSDDKIDFGFLRAHSDIYRIRQHVLGNEAATRLATSPALANIAQGTSALAIKTDLVDFFTKLKTVAPQPVAAPAPPPPPTQLPVMFPLAILSARTVSAASLSLSEATAVPATTVQAAPLQAAAVPAATFAPTATAAASPAPAVAFAAPEAFATAATIAPAVNFISRPVVDGTTLISGAPAAVGVNYVFRTASIAQRIQDPVSVEALHFALVSKHDAVNDLLNLPIGLDIVQVPGSVPLSGDTASGKLLTLGDFRGNATRLARILTDEYPTKVNANDPDPDEATVYSIAVRVVEDTLQLYRLCEGVIATYRATLSALQGALDALTALSQDTDLLLGQVDRQLDQDRHQVATARALLADEQKRVADVNARRDAAVAAQVHFLAYVRGRTTDAALTAPVRTLDPTLPNAAVQCLADPGETPPEIHALVELFRDGPVAWFPALLQAMQRLDRLEAIARALRMAKLRAVTRYQLGYSPWTWDPSPGRYTDALARVLTAQRNAITELRVRAAGFDLGLLDQASWQDAQGYARDQMSIGDLVDGGHGRPDLARQAAKLLEDIGTIGGCLHARLSRVAPRVRLEWAERLNEYEGPTLSLRNLGALPRWNDLDFVDRHDLQQHVDWLYAQVSASTPGAVGMVNDLVRVCILLASHSPVDQILSGHVHQQAPTAVGAAVTIAVPAGTIRVGMAVTIYTLPDQPTVRAQVEDVNAGFARTRVVWAADGVHAVPQGAAARFEHPPLGAVSFGGG
jgi:hypothetical protein